MGVWYSSRAAMVEEAYGNQEMEETTVRTLYSLQRPTLVT